MYKPLIAALISAGLASLGAPLLQQVREGIKDFWYRNHQDKVRAELENERTRLEIESEHSESNRRRSCSKFFVVVFVVNPATGKLESPDPKLNVGPIRECIENLLKRAS